MSDYAVTLSETFEVPADTPLLDAEQVEMLAAAGEDLLNELIETFSEECLPRLDELQATCESGSDEDIRLHVHFIAGSAANLGLLRLAELCRNIEMQIKEDRFSARDRVHFMVATEYSNGLADLMDSY